MNAEMKVDNMLAQGIMPTARQIAEAIVDAEDRARTSVVIPKNLDLFTEDLAAYAVLRLGGNRRVTWKYATAEHLNVHRKRCAKHENIVLLDSAIKLIEDTGVKTFGEAMKASQKWPRAGEDPKPATGPIS